MKNVEERVDDMISELRETGGEIFFADLTEEENVVIRDRVGSNPDVIWSSTGMTFLKEPEQEPHEDNLEDYWSLNRI